MQRKVKRLKFVNGVATINLRHVTKMSLDSIKDQVDITMTDCGYFIKYKEKDGTDVERFMPLSMCFDVELEIEKKAQKVA